MTAYPRVSRRLQAFLMDGVVLSAGSVGTLIAVSEMGLQGVNAVTMAGLTAFLLEPALVSFTGGTLGHHLMGLKVVSKEAAKNIKVFSALIRFSVKIPLALLSIIPIFTTRQYQTIHDLLIGSIVILKHPQTMRPYEVLREREIEEQGYSYPSRKRRVIVAVLYNLALFYFLEFILMFFLSEKCASYNQCLGTEKVIAYSLTLLWIAGVFAAVILCWRGMLLGCQRKLANG